MGIRSRFGCEIRITSQMDEEGYLKAIRLEDNLEKSYHISDLRADDGWKEIDETQKKCPRQY